MCIVRAGATSLAEISFSRSLFDYTLLTSKDNHQMKNAEFYEKKDVVGFDQKRINKVKLTNFIINLLSDKTD